MVPHILKIKTSIPPLGVNILSRPSMLERMEEDLTVARGFTRQLTLVSAPAGFGKTTLVRTWLAGREERTAWYSLDEGDNEPERFWLYLVSALQTLKYGVGKGILEIARSSAQSMESPTGSEALLTTLLNDLFALETPLFLIMDDYHLISNPQIHQDMIFFIENLPPTLHLAVTTRSDPPWPLSRWRARGKMGEVRLKELKFSEAEAGQLFEQYKEFELSESQLNTLYHKTEGWITGLQLAAFSLSSSGDVNEFISQFAGSHRHVLHFLSDEVFALQPEPTQDFLLQTSILNRFDASLCNAVTGRADSADVLADLDRHNLFVIPLDDRGNWYRYHQLFSDLLQYHLKRRAPEKVIELHERAGKWFLEAGEPVEAVRHAFTSNNLDEAGRILHDHYKDILSKDGPKMLNQCLEGYPQDLTRKYPRLAVHKALYHLIYKGKEEARPYIKLAEELGYENKKEHEEYQGLLAAVKSYDNIYSHDFSRALENAERALQLLPADNYFWRMNVAIYSGDARLFSGNPKGAYPYYQEAFWNSQKLNNTLLMLTAGFKTATALYMMGQLKEAEEHARELLQKTKSEGLSRVTRAGLLWVLLGELLREKGDLEEAERCLERGLFLSEPEKPSLGWNALFKVGLFYSRQDAEKAWQTIRQIKALNLEVELPQFITRPATVWEARLLLEQGKGSMAKALLSSIDVSEDTPVQGGQEGGYLVLARLLMEEDEGGQMKAGQLLGRIEASVIQGGHKKRLLETLLVKTRLAEQTGNHEAAERCLLAALEAGKEAAFFQVFLDEGVGIVPVFSRAAEALLREKDAGVNEDLLKYIRDIQQALSPAGGGTAERTDEIAEEIAGGAGRMPEIDTTRRAEVREGKTTRAPGRVETKAEPEDQAEETSKDEVETNLFQELVEALSSRELEVLGLISQGLSNQDISEKLFLSVGTVKWHTSNIFGKLGVRNRTQAVAQAQKLKLIS